MVFDTPHFENERGNPAPPFFFLLFSKSWSLPYCVASFKNDLYAWKHFGRELS